MSSLKMNLLNQRFKYLLKGNSHGVSANWLSKRTHAIFSSVDQFLQDDPMNLKLNLRNLKYGEELFIELLEKNAGINYGVNFDCEKGLASFLYAYILNKKPDIVIETGVANGISTNIIMSALEKTGGALHSFDIDKRVKNVYNGNGPWHFHLLEGNFQKDLEQQVDSIRKVDLWLHDSNHGFSWQAFEYGLSLKKLSSEGLLVSDDIDSSTAWGLSKSLFSQSFGIFDSRKFFGIAKKSKKDF